MELQPQVEMFAVGLAEILYSALLLLLVVAVEGLNLIVLLQTLMELLAALAVEQGQAIQVI